MSADMNMNGKGWTPEAGLRRGLFAGAVAAVVLGAVIILASRFVALPWGMGGIGGYDVFLRMFLVGAIGYGFAWGVVAIAQHAAGMASRTFDAFAVGIAVLLGITLGMLAVGQARDLAGEDVSAFVAVLSNTIPILGGALIAVALRRS